MAAEEAFLQNLLKLTSCESERASAYTLVSIEAITPRYTTPGNFTHLMRRPPFRHAAHCY